MTTRSAQSATLALRRVLGDRDPPAKVFLITDERTSLPLGRTGFDYYEELRQRGAERFRPIELRFAEYAELDALQATMGLARSGDLEIELPGGWTRPVSPQEVAASLRRQDRYATAPLLKELMIMIPNGPQPLQPELNSAAS
jgi:hypothetical protein